MSIPRPFTHILGSSDVDIVLVKVASIRALEAQMQHQMHRILESEGASAADYDERLKTLLEKLEEYDAANKAANALFGGVDMLVKQEEMLTELLEKLEAIQ